MGSLCDNAGEILTTVPDTEQGLRKREGRVVLVFNSLLSSSLRRCFFQLKPPLAEPSLSGFLFLITKGYTIRL